MVGLLRGSTSGPLVCEDSTEKCRYSLVSSWRRVGWERWVFCTALQGLVLEGHLECWGHDWLTVGHQFSIDDVATRAGNTRRCLDTAAGGKAIERSLCSRLRIQEISWYSRNYSKHMLPLQGYDGSTDAPYVLYLNPMFQSGFCNI